MGRRSLLKERWINAIGGLPFLFSYGEHKPHGHSLEGAASLVKPQDEAEAEAIYFTRYLTGTGTIILH